MKQAIIGVVPLWDEDKNSLWMIPGYMDGIITSGGLPVMLPLTADPGVLLPLADACDGFLFTGGQDVDPTLYGEAPLPECGKPCPLRDAMEKLLLEHAVLGQDKPGFGICRGIQFINAVLGGSLYQDLPSQHGSAVNHHQSPPYDRPVHRVTILPDTPLHGLLGADELRVNSYHHQAVRALAPSLRPAAISEDGLIEAVFLPDRTYALAVQWHPELAPEDPYSKKLFDAFVQAAAARADAL
jgi:putative glutamine amidotransferase